MADLLSNQYATVFSTPIDPKQLPGKPRQLTSSGQSLHSISFTEEDIIQAINEISLTAAAGPDGFPAILLKKCKEVLAIPLTIFWRKCLDQGIIPQSLKRSMIAPHHKGNSRAEAVNYRPIALTSQSKSSKKSSETTLLSTWKETTSSTQTNMDFDLVDPA